MKRHIVNIFPLAVLFVAVFSSCKKDRLDIEGGHWEIPAVTFVTNIDPCTDIAKSAIDGDDSERFTGTENLSDSQGKTVIMGCYESDSDITIMQETKANIINTSGTTQSLAQGFKVTAWVDDTSEAFISGFQDVQYNSGSQSWTLTNAPLWGDKRSRTFFAYANDDDDDDDVHKFSCTDKDSLIMTYIVPDAYSAQTDVVMAAWRGTTVPEGGNIPTGEVNLTFRHPLAAVSFTLGAIEGVESITKVTIDGVYSKGTVIQDYTGAFSWNTSDAENKIITIDNGSGSVIKDIVEDSNPNHLLLIPQDFSAKPVTITLTVTKTEGGTDTMLAFLKSGKWEAGKHYKYKIGDNLPLIEVTENKTVKNTGTIQCFVRATVTGNWYVGDMIVAPWTYGDTPDGWTSSDGYLYRTDALDPGAETTAIPIDKSKYVKPASAPDEAILKVRIHAQASGVPF